MAACASLFQPSQARSRAESQQQRQHRRFANTSLCRSTDLEKLSLYARHLYPLLRESTPEDDPIDLSSVELSR